MSAAAGPDATRPEVAPDGDVNPVLRLLLSALYPGALAPEHWADLTRSGLTLETVVCQRIMAVPPDLVRPLLGFEPPGLRSAMLIPYPDPVGAWMPHVRVKVFPALMGRDGHTIKYLGPKGSPPRLFFPLSALASVFGAECPLWLVEGAKKALAVAQHRFPTVGFEGIEGWHTKGSRVLLPGFDPIPLRGRIVELVPDGDVQTNPTVRLGVERLAEALRTKGARPRLVVLPTELAA